MRKIKGNWKSISLVLLIKEKKTQITSIKIKRDITTWPTDMKRKIREYYEHFLPINST